MTNVVLYLRVSSPEQNTHIQKLLCDKYIAQHGYKLIKTITEHKSAYKKNLTRELAKFIQNPDNLTNFSKLIVYNYDRFSRNIIDGIDMIEYLKQHNIIVESVIDNINYETPCGRKALAERFVLAQYESDLISHRVRQAYDYKRYFGLHIGAPPFGKRIEPIQKRILINNCEEQKIINFIKLAKQGGLTSQELTNIVNDIKPLEPDDIIGTFDKNNKPIEPSPSMSNQDISEILNDCNIRKRSRSWTPQSVAKLIKLN